MKKGLSLLEVILALVILGGSVAILGELTRGGLRNARDTRELTQAQFLAESLMAQIRMGIRELETDYDRPITSEEFVDTNAAESDYSSEPLWLYSIEASQIDDYGLYAVAVTVKRNLPNEPHPVTVRLLRWVVDPEVETEEADLAAEIEAEASSSSSSGSSQ